MKCNILLSAKQLPSSICLSPCNNGMTTAMVVKSSLAYVHKTGARMVIHVS